MNTQLIPVFAGELAGASTQLVDARSLHSFLKVDSHFKDWIARRIEEYEFIDGKDFCSYLSKTKGRSTKNYSLSIEMAKELGMIERSEKGRQIRRYFLEMEQIAKAGHELTQQTLVNLQNLQAELLKTNPRLQDVLNLSRLGYSQARIGEMLGLGSTTIYKATKRLRACGFVVCADTARLPVQGGV